MIDTLNLQEARKQIESLYKEGNKVVVQGKSIEFNRVILENKKVNMLILSHKDKKDRLKQQDSGLNHVLCNLAKANNIILTFDFSELLNKDKKEKALILARWEQNIQLIKKSKNKIKLVNTEDRDKRDLFSFLLTLGLDTNSAKEAVS